MGTVALTPREAAVASLVILGSSNRAIAASLGIGVKAVEKHLASVYRKHGVHSRWQLLVRLTEARDVTEYSPNRARGASR